MLTRILIFAVFTGAHSLKMFESELNVNDILRTDLMPTYFIEEGNKESTNYSVSERSESVNGSMDAALLTLDYHRSVQYLSTLHTNPDRCMVTSYFYVLAINLFTLM